MMAVAVLVAVPCARCGRTIAERDGNLLVLRREGGEIRVSISEPAIIECYRKVQRAGRWQACGHVNAIQLAGV